MASASRARSRRCILGMGDLGHCCGRNPPKCGRTFCNDGRRLATCGSRHSGLMVEQRLLEYISAVVVQVGVLLSRELADAHAGINAPRTQELVADFWNNHELLTA